jgi:hypothetical protein
VPIGGRIWTLDLQTINQVPYQLRHCCSPYLRNTNEEKKYIIIFRKVDRKRNLSPLSLFRSFDRLLEVDRIGFCRDHRTMTSSEYLPCFIVYNAHTSIVRTWISTWFLAKKLILFFKNNFRRIHHCKFILERSHLMTFFSFLPCIVRREYFSVIFNVKKCALYSIKYGKCAKNFLWSEAARVELIAELHYLQMLY